MSETVGNVKTVGQAPEQLHTDPRYLIQDISAYTDVRSLNIYDFMIQTYEGTHGYRDGSYLIPFAREVFYEDRMRSATYVNLFKPIVDAMITPVFNDEIKRATNNDVFEAFFKNVDNAGTSLDCFSNNIITHAKIYGFTFVVIDNFPDVLDYTKSEVLSRRLYPYAYEKPPQQLKEIKFDNYNRLISISFFDSIQEISGKKTQIYREWNANESILYWEKGAKKIRTVISSTPHNLGIIPVICVNYFLKSKKIDTLPSPIYYDLAMLNYQLFNKETYIQELEKYQTFSLLVAQGLNKTSVSAGPTNFLNIDKDTPNLPQYISPNVENTRVLVENCDRLKEEIYKQAGQKGVIAVKEAQSGYSKEFDFRGEEAILKEVSTAAAKFEQDLAFIFSKYLNTEIKLESKYPEDFSPQYYNQRVEVLLNILKEMPPDIVATELWAEIATIIWKQTPDKAEEIIQQLKIDIDQKKEMSSYEDDNDTDIESGTGRDKP